MIVLVQDFVARDDERVRVFALTMHAAKGLEFSEVLLPFWNQVMKYLYC
jgi:superfamily I DNA/RNA helicase